MENYYFRGEKLEQLSDYSIKRLYGYLIMKY